MVEAAGRRRSWRPAAISTAALLAGLLPAAAWSADGPAGRVSSAYDCRSVLGTQEVNVAVAQSYPAVGAVGRPVQPGEPVVTVTLPRAAAAALLPAGTQSVAGTGSLTALVAQGTSTAEADWGGLTAPAVPLAGTADLSLTFTGPVAPVTVSAPGDVTFSAGDLALVLSAAPPDGAPAGTTELNCTQKDGGITRLGSVPVPAPEPGSQPPAGPSPTGPSPAGPSPSPTVGASGRASAEASAGARPSATAASPGGAAGATTFASPSARPAPASGAGADLVVPRVQPPAGGGTITVDGPVHSGVSECPAAPSGELDPRRLPPVPEGALVLPMPGADPFEPVPACAYAVGYANIGKLGGAALINDPRRQPALVRVDMHKRIVMLWTDDDSPGYIEADGIGALDLPPAESTFLTFGFMPTTAKMKLTPLGPLTFTIVGNTDWDQPVLTAVGGYQALRLYDVEINGTPLDVGPNCRTVSPIDLTLRGRQDAGISSDDGKPDYTVQTGGPLAAENLVIPPFTGCGAGGEDLSPLLTAAVSGAGNSLNFIQGALCTPTSDQPNGCLPEIEMPAPPHR